MSNQKIETIVLIGPNHFNTGNAPILISTLAYQTPWGLLENNIDFSTKIIKAKMAVIEEQPFENEHSISTLVGFIKHTFPQVKIVPIIIKRGSSLQKSEELGEWLAQNLPENALVLVSADFSHHFNLEKTLVNDKKNLEILKNLDKNEISEMEVDTKQSMALLFTYLEAKKAKNFNYHYTNAAEILHNKNYQDVTSYFFAYFLKGEMSFQEY